MDFFIGVANTIALEIAALGAVFIVLRVVSFAQLF
jgi:hypothetical protein